MWQEQMPDVKLGEVKLFWWRYNEDSRPLVVRTSFHGCTYPDGQKVFRNRTGGQFHTEEVKFSY